MYFYYAAVSDCAARDFDNDPIDQTVVDGIMEIANKTGKPVYRKFNGKKEMLHTGMWNNLVLATTRADFDQEKIEKMTPSEQLKASEEFNLIAPAGHHRRTAAAQLGVTVGKAADVRIMTEDEMIDMMVQENALAAKGARTATTLSALGLVVSRAMEPVYEAENFTAYKKAGHKFFSSAKQFNPAKKNALPGWRSMIDKLGKHWTKQIVQAGLAVMSNVNDGVYDLKDVTQFNNMGQVRMFNQLTKAIVTSDYPPVIRNYILRQCIDIVAEKQPPGSTIEVAAKQFKLGKSPCDYIKKQLPIALNTQAIVKDLLRDPDLNLREQSGMDSDDYKKMIAAAEAALKKETRRAEREAAREELAKGGISDKAEQDKILIERGLLTAPSADGDAPPPAEDVEGDFSLDDDGNLVDSDGNPVDTTPSGDAPTDAVDDTPPDYSSSEVRNSIKTVMMVANPTLTTVGMQLSPVLGRVAEVQAEEQGPAFVENLTTLFELTVQLMAEVEGFGEVVKRVRKVSKQGVDM